MSGPVLKPLFISLGIMLFQQTTGINAVVFYTVSIFQTAGSTLDGRYATIIVGFVQLVFTVASGFTVKSNSGTRSRSSIYYSADTRTIRWIDTVDGCC